MKARRKKGAFRRAGMPATTARGGGGMLSGGVLVQTREERRHSAEGSWGNHRMHALGRPADSCKRITVRGGGIGAALEARGAALGARRNGG